MEFNNKYGALEKHSGVINEITQMSSLDNTYENLNIRLVYDEILIIYYLYRCLHDCSPERYYVERELMIDTRMENAMLSP